MIKDTDYYVRRRKHKAYNWLVTLDSNYNNWVSYAKEHTYTVVGEDVDKNVKKRHDKTDVRVLNTTVIECIRSGVIGTKVHDVCILNFASVKRPGGGFLSGRMAQEESLCHNTGLFPCISQESCKEYYREAYKQSNLPISRIYTTGCPVIVSGKVYFVDILTMAAVDRRRDYYTDCDDLMLKCQENAFLIPARYGINTVLLGAWGCGVFKNDPKMVATNWKNLTDKYQGLYARVIHPISDYDTYKIFKNVIG